MLTPLTPFECGLLAHLVADWLLQNEWMASNKSNLRHPAAWVHSALHGLLLGAALGWRGGVALGVLHLVVDTGWPLDWWIRVFKKCDQTPQAAVIRLWTDQVIHIAAIGAWLACAPALWR
jgi:hypothetical protein